MDIDSIPYHAVVTDIIRYRLDIDLCILTLRYEDAAMDIENIPSLAVIMDIGKVISTRDVVICNNTIES